MGDMTVMNAVINSRSKLVRMSAIFRADFIIHNTAADSIMGLIFHFQPLTSALRYPNISYRSK